MSVNLFNKVASARHVVARRGCASVAALALLAWSAGTAFAAETPLQNVVNLQADATTEVNKDVLSIVFTTTKEGSDANAVQAALKQALDAALAEAKAAAKPNGQLDVRTGNFSLYPRYAPKGGITGWQGSAELVVEGRDMAAISQLSGRLNTMTVGRVATQLSREQRKQVEGDVTAAAIANYQAKAAAYARQFGFAGYQIREVSVSSSEQGQGPMPAPMMRAMKASQDEAPLPVEAGKTTVNVTVQGSIVMTR